MRERVETQNKYLWPYHAFIKCARLLNKRNHKFQLKLVKPRWAKQEGREWRITALFLRDAQREHHSTEELYHYAEQCGGRDKN